MRWLRIILGCACASGCAVAEYQYPLTWDPLPPAPSERCARFPGTYADRGERAEDPTKPSLTRELLGEHADWEEATRVQLAMPDENTLDIAVWGDKGRLEFVSLRADKKHFACDHGRLVIRSRRWIGGYIMSGRQHVTLELNDAGRYLTTQVDEFTYGLMFIIFPVTGTAKHWYRFERL
jgi:hypothetical protein